MCIRDSNNGTDEPWLLLFKNETHNHPTETEPFGGAATCIGGAIRDPLANRGSVYQAMRVTGAGDPLVPVRDTMPGKLPQRKLVTVSYTHLAKNAAVLAAQMLAIHDARIAALLAEDREKMARSIAEKDAAIRAEAAAL